MHVTGLFLRIGNYLGHIYCTEIVGCFLTAKGSPKGSLPFAWHGVYRVRVFRLLNLGSFQCILYIN